MRPEVSLLSAMGAETRSNAPGGSHTDVYDIVTILPTLVPIEYIDPTHARWKAPQFIERQELFRPFDKSKATLGHSPLSQESLLRGVGALAVSFCGGQ
jgi:hypothetical protein